MEKGIIWLQIVILRDFKDVVNMDVLRKEQTYKEPSWPPFTRLHAISSIQLISAIVRSNLQVLSLTFKNHYSYRNKKQAFSPSNIMSTTIAIAGGTGNIGKTISDALVATGKYKVIVLAREVEINYLSSLNLFIPNPLLT